MAQDPLPDCSCFHCVNQPEKGDENPALFTFGGCECGNKRCPKSTCHLHACTRSNEPGQLGSRYGVLDESCTRCMQKQATAEERFLKSLVQPVLAPMLALHGVISPMQHTSGYVSVVGNAKQYLSDGSQVEIPKEASVVLGNNLCIPFSKVDQMARAIHAEHVRGATLRGRWVPPTYDDLEDGDRGCYENQAIMAFVAMFSKEGA